jgi:hypothetical protein
MAADAVLPPAIRRHGSSHLLAAGGEGDQFPPDPVPNGFRPGGDGKSGGGLGGYATSEIRFFGVPPIATYPQPMQAPLTCDACRTTAGVYSSYEEWSDRASALGWAIGEDTVLCGDCLDPATRAGRSRVQSEPGPDRA